MDGLIFLILDNLQSIDWNGSFTMILLLMGFLALMRKWGLIMTMLVIIVMGIGGSNLIIMNAQTSQQLISVSHLVYAIGGTVLGIVTLLACIKIAVS